MARNPDNLIEQNYVDPVTDIIVEDVPDFLFEDFDPNDSKQVVKYFYRIEKVVRNSFEYKQFIRFLKEYGDMNECSFMKYVTGAESYDIRIEIHHEPITLYDIVVAVYNRRAANGESIHEDMVAKEVMYNHYRLYCGLIPLSETVHELVHNQFLFIPSFAVFGAWEKFVEEYKDYIPADVLANLEAIQYRSKNYDFDQEAQVLKAGFVNISVGDDSYNESLEDLYQYLKNVLDDLKNKQEHT